MLRQQFMTQIHCLATLLVAAFINVAGAQVVSPSAAYQVQPGDVLTVSVWNETELQRKVLVRPDGGFSFPLVGDVSAIGKSVPELEQLIVQRLVKYIPKPVVTVAVEDIQGNKIYVIGQVQRPGAIVMNPRVDVMQALSIAGGTTPFAQLDDIKILRRKGTEQIVLAFRYSDVSKGRNLGQNVQLESGDVVVVP